MELSWQEYWSGLPFPPPGDLPNPETEPTSPASPALQADSLPAEHQGSPKGWELLPHGLQSTKLLCPWNYPGKNTGVGCHFLLQGIFLTQESDPGLPHCRQIF